MNSLPQEIWQRKQSRFVIGLLLLLCFAATFLYTFFQLDQHAKRWEKTLYLDLQKARSVSRLIHQQQDRGKIIIKLANIDLSAKNASAQLLKVSIHLEKISQKILEKANALYGIFPSGGRDLKKELLKIQQQEITLRDKIRKFVRNASQQPNKKGIKKQAQKNYTLLSASLISQQLTLLLYRRQQPLLQLPQKNLSTLNLRWIILGAGLFFLLWSFLSFRSILSELRDYQEFQDDRLERLYQVYQRLTEDSEYHSSEKDIIRNIEEISNFFLEQKENLLQPPKSADLPPKEKKGDGSSSQQMTSSSFRRLRAIKEDQSQVLTMISHQLRTPLNVIIGYGDLLVEEAQEQELHDFAKDLKKIQKAGRDLLQRVEEIVELSRLDLGLDPMQIEEFDVVAMLQETIDQVRPLAEQNKNMLLARYPLDLGKMETDLSKLQKSLYYLLADLCKSKTYSEIVFKAERKREAEKDWLFFTVFVQAEYNPQEARHQIKSISDISTLSLAIGKRFAELMGGKLFIDLEAEHGLFVSLRLPSKQAGTPSSSILMR